MRFVTGIGSHDYGGQKFPGSASSKLENQECWRWNPVQGPENLGADDVSPA